MTGSANEQSTNISTIDVSTTDILADMRMSVKESVRQSVIFYGAGEYT